ncbi:MAG TPA: hypothetical protein VLG37_04015 [Candidatus Saccharimonadales bacterium]|nr:hypothetical protein [Candidatus Saccharimonadales bacterium]
MNPDEAASSSPSPATPNTPDSSSPPTEPATVEDTITPEPTATPGQVTSPGGAATSVPNEATPSASNTPSQASQEMSPSTSPAMASHNTKMGPNKKRRLTLLVIIVIAALVLISGAVAAYYAYVLPNQPDKVLKTAIENTLQQKTTNLKGTFTADSTDSAHPSSFKLDVQGSSDAGAKATDFTLTLTTAGVTFPLEVRLVDQNLYMKVGDLTTLVGLLNGFSPQIGGAASALAKSVSNKWIVFDSTLLKQAGAGCFLDNSWALTKADITYLESQYETNKFVDIKSTADDTVDGQAAKKFVLSMDDNKGAAYFKTLDQMPTVKALSSCSKAKSQPLDTKFLADGDHTPLTVWVDKANKRIVKVEMQSTAQDLQKSHQKGTATVSISYDKVTVTAPQGAEPALQVLSELQQELSKNPGLQSLFGGGAKNSFSF